MTASTTEPTAGDVRGIPGRPARPEDSERGEHTAESVLSLSTGAGPTQEDCMPSPRPARPDRPVRFEDPARNAAYWARIDAIVSEAPPLTNEQKAIIRAAIHAPQERGAAA